MKNEFGEPWEIIDGNLFKCNSYGLNESDKERAMKCVNACAGLSDEQLKRVRAVDAMYRACKQLVRELDSLEATGGLCVPSLGAVDQMKKALALADAVVRNPRTYGR